MKKIYSVVFGLVIALQCISATYYVDINAASGENGLSPTTAFNSLAQVNSLTLSVGDSVLLNRGDVFRETLIIRNSGNSSSPIYFGAYGTGNAPVISGADVVTGWTNSSGSIYTTTCPTCPGSLTQIYINEQLHIPARYPNNGYLSMSTVSDSGFTSSSLTDPSGAWDSAFVYARTVHWVIDQFTVKKYASGQITINPPNHFYTSYPFQQYFGFFLTGKPICLDSLSEWYYDSTNQTISIIPIYADTLTTYGAEVSVRSNCITANSINYIIIENLNLEKSLGDALLLQSTQHVTINNCIFTKSGRDGVGGMVNYSTTNSYLTVSNSTFTDISNTGIDLNNSGAGIVLKNNTIKHCGMVPGMGCGFDMGYEGIYCPSNSTVAGNAVDSVGYCAIHVNSNDSVTYNHCSHYGLTKDDCGGVYYWGATGNYIANNICHDGYGNGQGTIFPNNYLINGIYSDDQSNNNTIINNTVYRNQTGLLIHNTHNTVVRGNISYDNWGSQVFVNEGDPHFATVMVHDNKISNNIFQCLDPSQRTVMVQMEKNNAGTIGTLDSNYYLNPYTDKHINLAYTPGYNWGNSTMRYDELTLAEWNSNYGYESNGHSAYDYPTTYALWSKQGADQITNSTFSTSTGGWWTYGNSNFTISLDNTNPAMDGGSMKGQYAADTAIQVGNWGTSPLNIESGKTYLLTYSLQGAARGGMQVNLNEANAPYTSTVIPFWASKYFTSSRVDDTLLFYGNITNTVSLTINSTNVDGTFWMDNIGFFEVLADTSSSLPHETSILFTNPSFAPLTILSARNYRDLSGNIVTENITLAPFSSVVLKSLNATPVTGVVRPTANNTTLTIYPNPVNSSFQVSGFSASGNLTISVANQLGQLVYQKTISANENIYLPESLPAGIYIVKLTSEVFSQSAKIVYLPK